jgi:hypothetical protein
LLGKPKQLRDPWVGNRTCTPPRRLSRVRIKIRKYGRLARRKIACHTFSTVFECAPGLSLLGNSLRIRLRQPSCGKDIKTGQTLVKAKLAFALHRPHWA